MGSATITSADESARIVSAGFHTSLDGFIARRRGELDWLRLDAEIIDHAVETMRGIDTMLMGRNTYLEQAAHWPHQSGDLADAVNAHDKVVFTRSPESLDLAAWQRSRAASDPTSEVEELRATPGRRVGVSGGSRLLWSMLRHDLIDELRVFIHPVTLGTGSSPWPEDLRLRLATTHEFASGVVLHTYTPINRPAPCRAE